MPRRRLRHWPAWRMQPASPMRRRCSPRPRRRIDAEALQRDSAGPYQRNGLVALEQIEQAAQRFAARTRQSRVFPHDAEGLVARLADELGVYVRTRDAVTGHAALPHAKHIALAAKP